MTTPPPHRRPLRSGIGFSLLLFGWVLGFGACSPRPTPTVVLTSEGFEVLIQPSPTDEHGLYEWTVRHRNQTWNIRTRIPEVGSSSLSDDAIRGVVGRYLTWREPFLFIREDVGHREGSRASVDHVFKCEAAKVSRLGTLASTAGAPGSQFMEGRFRDAYDRLEFSPLASPENGPVFPIFMKEQGGRFRVDREATWDHNRPQFEKRRESLRAFPVFAGDAAIAADPGPASQSALSSPTPIARRAARADAFFCLALARYCDRDAEFIESVELARRVLDSMDDLLEEVATVVPGELAASRDEVLRANPALVNFFKESNDDPPDPDATPGPRSDFPTLALPPP